MTKKTLGLLLACVTMLTGCVAPKNPPPSQNLTTNVSTGVASNITTPWPDVPVFTRFDNSAINVTVGQEFVIRYDFYNSLVSSFEISYQPDGVVVNLNETQKRQDFPSLDGTEWFLFKAVTAGTTNLTIGERGHLMPVGFVTQQVFTINVGSSQPASIPTQNISPNTTTNTSVYPTGNPWPNVQVFTNIFTSLNPSINVTLGQEFVIPYNQFTTSNIGFQPADIVVFESKQFVQNPGVIIPDGTTWILFKAVAVGTTKVLVTEATRFYDPLLTKTLTINVGPASTQNTTGIAFTVITAPLTLDGTQPGTQIPWGSTIIHWANGITEAYGPDNNRIFIAKDASAAQITGPGGGKPATRSYQVPNGARIDPQAMVGTDNATKIYVGDQLILTIIEKTENFVY